MGVFIDIILIAAVAFATWRGIKSGLVRSVVGIAGLIVSLIIASTVAKSFSGEFADMIRPFVGGYVESKFQTILPKYDEAYVPPVGTEVEPGYDPDSPDDAAEHSDVWLLSEETLRKLGVFAPVARKLASSVEVEAESIGYSVSTVITDKLSAALSYISVFAVSFLLLAIICVVIGNLVNLAFSLPGLKLVDSILGGVLGAAKGLLLVFFAATVLRHLGLLTSSMIDKTTLLHYFVLHNPVASAMNL